MLVSLIYSILKWIIDYEEAVVLKVRVTKGKLKIISVLSLLFLFSACTASDATLMQASRELPFPVLVPSNIPEEWEIAEIVYEDELLVISYLTENDHQVDLVQDRNIQGLNVAFLRDYMLTGTVNEQLYMEGIEIKEISTFLGELTFFQQPVPTVQYTFVKKQDLFGSLERVPVYQVIGKEASFEDIKIVVDSLNVYSK
ncbi:hypothetical protein J2S74_004464 [Evansella vedderi]|uniref:Uncharacterized protein n=1 Tax=Evansella vedderi TaxID=38282 RepID=A0ABU0A1N1_9BACI|nr:hypothetical protein [Evansella vedderi]MDQ0257019.1 hypothetical protein [Evansella vedderi]